jgi:hypothetical protein
MVERVKITPSQILLKDGNGNVKFDTNSAYIKTGGGTLYAGGYARSPAIYGQGTENVIDHLQDGGFVSRIGKSGVNLDYDGPFGVCLVPKCNTASIRVLDEGELRYIQETPFTSSSRNVEYYNYDTGQIIDTGVGFNWNLTLVYSYGEYKYYIYPTFNTSTLPAVTNPNGGQFQLPYSEREFQYWSRQVQVEDYGGGYYNETQYGYIYGGFPTRALAVAVFCTRASVALSLAVTS